MFSHLAPFSGCSELGGPSTTSRHHAKLVSSNPPSDCSTSSTPFPDGGTSIADSYSDGWVLSSQLETLQESNDSRDQSYCTGYHRPTSTFTVNSNSTTTTSLTSPGVTHQDEDIFASSACHPIALSSNSVQPNPEVGSLNAMRSISGPHPILRSHSVTENYSRPRAAPQPPSIARSRSNSGVRRPQIRLIPETTRQLLLDPNQKRQNKQQHPRSSQQPPQHQANSRPHIAPVKQAFPRKLHLLPRSAPQTHPVSAIPQTHSQVVAQDGPRHSFTLRNPPSQPHTINKQKSYPCVRPTSGFRRPQSVIRHSSSFEPKTHGVQTTSSSQPMNRRSTNESSNENLRSVFAGPQSHVSQETFSSVQNTSTSSSSSNTKPSRRTLKAFLEPKPSIELLSQSVHQKQRVRPDSAASNTRRSSMHNSAAHKHKSLSVVGEGEKPGTVQTLIRKESQEELIKCLERLIGYDELRLLVPVDKLLPQSTDSAPEGANAGQSVQDTSNRKSIGNGLLGRFGWKQKKVFTPGLSTKNKPRNEVNTNDRRATFGFWGASSMRSSRVGVFGCPLEDSDPFSCVTVIGGQKHLIPTVMFCLIEEIYVRGMETPGFMRIAGKAELVDALAETFERPPHYGDGVDLGPEDIHVLCSLFKRYLRSLPEPLMSRDLFQVLWSHCIRERKGGRAGDVENKIATTQCLMRLMPARSFSLMIYVLAFLAQIPLYPRNKFSSVGIAKIFGPALFGARTQRSAAVDERPIQALKWILENWNMITEGLLDEYYVPQIPGPSSPILRSSQMDSISERHSSQPSISLSSQDVPGLQHEFPVSNSKPSLACSTIEPSISTSTSMTFAPLKSLRGYQSHSIRRDSLRSAQYIVDCYEAHEKTITGVQSVKGGVDGTEPENGEEGSVVRASKVKIEGLDRLTQQLDAFGGLTDNVTNSQAHNSYSDHIQAQAPATSDVGYSKDYNELHSNRISRNFQPQLLVLNEPLDPPSVFTTQSGNVPGLAGSTTNKPIETTESGKEKTQGDHNDQEAKSRSQIFRLSGIFSLEKLVMNVNEHPNFDEDRAKRIVQKSIEIVDKHQQLLLELKEQLYLMLKEDLKNTSSSSTH